MLTIVVVMVFIVALAGLVVVYVAYPHRGEEVPAAPWLGEVMAKAAEAAPMLEAEDATTRRGDRERQERAS